MEPAKPNPVYVARRVLRRLLKQGTPPDWALLFLARHEPDRPAAWTDEERARFNAAWRYLSPPETP